MYLCVYYSSSCILNTGVSKSLNGNGVVLISNLSTTPVIFFRLSGGLMKITGVVETLLNRTTQFQ